MELVAYAAKKCNQIGLIDEAVARRRRVGPDSTCLGITIRGPTYRRRSNQTDTKAKAVIHSPGQRNFRDKARWPVGANLLEELTVMLKPFSGHAAIEEQHMRTRAAELHEVPSG